MKTERNLSSRTCLHKKEVYREKVKVGRLTFLLLSSVPGIPFTAAGLVLSRSSPDLRSKASLFRGV